jgi:hypothetical protein
MTPTLWTGLIIIVCMLEGVRIALTTYVLLHVLESHSLRRAGETSGQARRSLRAAPARARREALYDPTLGAVRAAMDEAAQGRSGPATQAAVIALERYARALVDEQGTA